MEGQGWKRTVLASIWHPQLLLLHPFYKKLVGTIENSTLIPILPRDAIVMDHKKTAFKGHLHDATVTNGPISSQP